MSTVAVNVNDQVSVRLTGTGKRLFDDYHANLGLAPLVYAAHHLQDDGSWRFSLWELAHIFGPGLRMGPGPLFEKNIVTITVP